MMKTAAILFAEAPVPGETKPGLTAAYGGVLSEEDAAEFYAACLLDVIDVAAAVCDELFLCVRGDAAILQERIARDGDAAAITRIIANRAERFGAAVDEALATVRAQSDAGAFLLLAGDIPDVQAATMRDLLNKVAEEEQAVACCPSQDGSFTLLALTRATALDFTEIFRYGGKTPLTRLVGQVAANRVPLRLGAMVTDVDSTIDLGAMLPLLHALSCAAAHKDTLTLPRRTLQCLQELGLQATAAPAPTDEGTIL